MKPVQINYDILFKSDSEEEIEAGGLITGQLSLEGGEDLLSWETEKQFIDLKKSTESSINSSSGSQSDVDQDITGIVESFGIIGTEPMELADSLKVMTQTVIDNTECRSLLEGARSTLLMDSHFCAIDAASACMFDSGYGFIVNQEGVNYLVGVLSLFTNMCRPQFPTMYTRVSDYTEFLEHYLQLWA